MTYADPNGRNRLLSSIQPADSIWRCFSPHIKDCHLKQGVVIQEAGVLIEQSILRRAA
jgi:hypothetical protein